MITERLPEALALEVGKSAKPLNTPLTIREHSKSFGLEKFIWIKKNCFTKQ